MVDISFCNYLQCLSKIKNKINMGLYDNAELM